MLSPKYGLVHSDALLEPYDVALAEQPDDYRQAWAGCVSAKLRRVEGDLHGRRIEVHAGQAYSMPLQPPLRAAGAHVAHPIGRGAGAAAARGARLAYRCRPGAGQHLRVHWLGV